MWNHHALQQKIMIVVDTNKTIVKRCAFPQSTIHNPHSFLKIALLLIFMMLLSQLAWAAKPLKTIYSKDSNTAHITDFRYSRENNKTRLVFDVSGPIHYSAQLRQPQIILILKNAKLIAFLNKTWFYKTPVQSIRSDQFGHDLKLTLTLKSAVTLQHFVLDNPNRIVLDLTPTTQQQMVTSNTIKNDTTPIVAAKSVPTIISPTPQPESATNNSSVLNTTPATTTVSQESAPASMPAITDLPSSSGKLRPIMVVIDPGHGGKDPGATGAGGTHEKDVVLAIAKDLQKDIDNTKGFHAILTRNSDYFIGLRERLNIAHRYKADMFIAVHADAYKYGNSRGASVFALSQRGATSEAAHWLAEKENESELGQSMADKDHLLRSVLIDLAQTATIGASLEIGGNILDELGEISRLHSRRVEQAAFVVLKSPDIPSLLVETGFISDSYEEERLRNSKYQNQVAQCLAAGIVDYFTKRPPIGTYLASVKLNRYNSRTTLQDSLPN